MKQKTNAGFIFELNIIFPALYVSRYLKAGKTRAVRVK